MPNENMNIHFKTSTYNIVQYFEQTLCQQNVIKDNLHGLIGLIFAINFTSSQL